MHACDPNHISQVVMIFFFKKHIVCMVTFFYLNNEDAEMFCVFNKKGKEEGKETNL